MAFREKKKEKLSCRGKSSKEKRRENFFFRQSLLKGVWFYRVRSNLPSDAARSLKQERGVFMKKVYQVHSEGIYLSEDFTN